MNEWNNGWSAEVDRGPDWLLVRLHAPAQDVQEDVELADGLLTLTKKHLIRRMVLELDDIGSQDGKIIGALVELNDRVRNEGGTLRICGLSAAGQQELRARSVDAFLPVYRDRREAVMAPRIRIDGAHG